MLGTICVPCPSPWESVGAVAAAKKLELIAGLGWARLGWAGLGWAGLGWARQQAASC